MGSWRRAISPVIGVLLMVVLTVLMASVLATGLMSMDGGLDVSPFVNATGGHSGSGGSSESASSTNLNPWSGSSGDLVRVSNNSAGATDVRYRINFTIEKGSDTIGNSLNSVELELTNGSSPDMFSGTDKANLEKVVVDEGSDGSIDQNITSDVDGWTPQNGGSKLKIGFSGSMYSANATDSVIVTFDGVDNPTNPGSYDLKAQTSGDGNWHYGTIEIIED